MNLILRSCFLFFLYMFVIFCRLYVFSYLLIFLFYAGFYQLM